MNHKRTTTSIVLAALMLVSLFAVVSSAANVSGQTMAGTGPALSSAVTEQMTGGAHPVGYGGFADYFAVDTSGALWHTNGSGSWDSLGGVCTSSPAAVSPWNSSTFSVDIFVRGSNGALYWKYYQNGWSNWKSLGGQVASGTGPAAASWSPSRLDVFVEGTNGALYHKWSTNSGTTWSNWENLGGKLTASPAATFDTVAPYPPANSVYVFVRGTDGAVWQKYWKDSKWSNWQSLGGQLAPGTGPAVSQDLALFVQGTDQQLWHKYSEGSGWSAWGTLAGAPSEALSTASPGTVLPPSLEPIVCVSGTSGNLWASGDPVGNYNIWYSVGSPP
jgi:hypothetical protein